MEQESRTPTADFASFDATPEAVQHMLSKGDDPSFLDAYSNGRVNVVEKVNTPEPQEQTIYEDEVKPLEDIQEHQEEAQEQEELETGTSESEVEESPDEQSPEAIDEVEAKRKLWDEQQTKLQALEDDKARLAEEAKVREEGLQKELEDLRTKQLETHDPDGEMTDEEFDRFLNGVDSKLEAVDTANTQDKVVDTPESTNDLKELKAKVDEMQRERNLQKQKDQEELIAKEYESFFSSEYATNLELSKPAKEAMKDVDDFYTKLTDELGSQVKATRFMLDLTNENLVKSREQELSEMGLEKPSDFDSAFVAVETRMFKDGKKFDKDTGQLITVRENPFESMEEAYFNLHGKELIAEQNVKAHKDIKAKLDHRNNSAQTVNPNQYVAPPTANLKNTKSYVDGLLKQVGKYVDNGELKTNRMPPDLQLAYREYKAMQQNLTN